MLFNTVPAGDFVDREIELNYLKRLIVSGDRNISNNILLEGTSGIGKTELLKQLYHSVFWEEGNAIPFYYSFQRATMKTSYFARDYFSRFVRQYLAYLKKDPSIIENMSVPMARLIPIISSLRIEWMIDLIEDFSELMKSDDMHAQMLGALSAPIIAAGKNGRHILIMLDDFHLAMQLYDTKAGDVPGLISLFEGTMKTSLCPHIVTGSPEGVLESIFTDNSFRGIAERLFVKALPEDAALSLFTSLCSRMEIKVHKDACLRFLKCLDGNPLYIRNIARALWKMQKKDVTERDLWECYSHEISEGETAFYWSSVLGEFIKDIDQKRSAIELLMHTIRSNGEFRDIDRLSRVLNINETMLRHVLDALQKSGIIQSEGGIRCLKDNILQDFIWSLYMLDVEGRNPERVSEAIESKYSSADSHVSCFEMVIPSISDAELIAARGIEQIGRNIGLNAEVINHLQLATIESCINAMEHSGSYEKKVFIKILVFTGRIEIVIESSGKFFAPDSVEGQTIEEKLLSQHKRGWGLKLMRSIMDDVKIERVGDRTRVVLIKKIKPNEVLK